jgi:hypothetical protein
VDIVLCILSSDHELARSVLWGLFLSCCRIQGCWASYAQCVLSLYSVSAIIWCVCSECPRASIYVSLDISTGSPFVHTIHFPESAFSWVTEGALSKVEPFSPPEKPHKKRYRCKACGVCMASNNTLAKKWSVWGATLDRDNSSQVKGWALLKPTVHMFYDTRMLDINDGLGKWSGYEGKSEQLMI